MMMHRVECIKEYKRLCALRAQPQNMQVQGTVMDNKFFVKHSRDVFEMNNALHQLHHLFQHPHSDKDHHHDKENINDNIKNNKSDRWHSHLPNLDI